MIDCGSNIFERIIAKHLLDDVNNVHVAITHRHPDHIGSLGDLIFYCYYVKKIKVNILSGDKYINQLLLDMGVINTIYTFNMDSYINDLDLFINFKKTTHCCVYKLGNNYVDAIIYGYGDHTDLFLCYSIILKKDNEKIFYSGDTHYLDFENVQFDKYYIECCIARYPSNPHYNIDELNKTCKYNNIPVNKVWCMHFDSDEAIKRAKKLGFNVVTII